MIKRNSSASSSFLRVTAVTELVGRIADDDIKVHRKQVIRIVGVDEFVSVALQTLLSCLFSIGGLGGAAKDAFAAPPGVCDVFVADVAVGIVKTNDGIRPIGVFGAVHSAAGEEGRQLRNGDAEELISENVFQAILPVWDMSFQPLVEPFGNFPQKDAALAAGVQKGGGGVGKSSCGSRSSMALAISGGVNTSSLERLARQLNTSGLWMPLLMILLPAVYGNPWEGTLVPGIWVRIPEEVPLLPVPGKSGRFDHAGVHLAGSPGV